MANQESSADYFKLAKEIAKVEKSMKVERWVLVYIGYRDNDGWHNLYTYDLPVWQYDKWEWVPRWRRARLQCQHPRKFIENSFYYYRKTDGVTIGMQDHLNRFVAAKAQVTMQENIIRKYIEEQKATNFFFDEDTDEQLQKIRTKLQTKKRNVEEAEQRLMNLVNSIKNPNKQ